MAVTEHIGDIFAAPTGSVLIREPSLPHDTSPLIPLRCEQLPRQLGLRRGRGLQSQGPFLPRQPYLIQAHRRAQFPTAYQIYHKHCTVPGSTEAKKLLLGTCLLIPPQASDIPKSDRYWIACLMTSLSYGRRVDKPELILEYTRKSLKELKDQLQAIETRGQKEGSDFKDLYTVRLNVKAFKTPWNLTRKVLEESLLDVKVMNNLDVMDKKEREQTLDSMERSGDDIEKVKAIRIGRMVGTKETAKDDGSKKSMLSADDQQKSIAKRKTSGVSEGEAGAEQAKKLTDTAKRRKQSAKDTT